MKKIILFFLLSTSVFAHNEGHYEIGEPLKIWHLISGQTLNGNYLAINAHNEIIIEQAKGKKISIPFAQLTFQDQRFAKMKMRKVAQIQILPTKQNSNLSLLPLFFILIFLIGLMIAYEKLKLPFRYKKVVFYTIIFVSLVLACKSTSDIIPISPTNSIPKTEISFLDLAFDPYKNQLNTSSDKTYYYVNSTGIPNHNMMIGIKAWQQQVPISQSYSGTNHWSIPLQPVYSDSPLSTKSNLMKGAIALAVNGIPIFNALNNRGEDSFAIGELDQWGGHCGRADDYHYHAAPLHLSSISGLKPIAFALDGFPVYGQKEPDGSNMVPLDINHGHEWKDTYHYHGTNDYPYVIGAMRGKVTIDPTTSAPENQVSPQAFASPIRPALSPLNGAIIDDFSSTSSNAYLLNYHIGSKFGTVKYNWNTTGLYTFTFTDINGNQTSSTYQRK